MHIYLYPRGIYPQVEIWKTLVQGQFFKWRRINLKTNQEEIILVQGALRPTLLGAYEYIFPEESLAEVITMLGITQEEEKDYRIKVLRKLFGTTKIPQEIWDKAKTIPPSFSLVDSERGLSHCRVNCVGVTCAGIKKDKRMKWEEQGYEQELL